MGYGVSMTLRERWLLVDSFHGPARCDVLDLWLLNAHQCAMHLWEWERGGEGREEEEEEVGGREEGRIFQRRRSTGGVAREELGGPDLFLNAAKSPASAIGV